MGQEWGIMTLTLYYIFTDCFTNNNKQAFIYSIYNHFIAKSTALFMINSKTSLAGIWKQHKI